MPPSAPGAGTNRRRAGSRAVAAVSGSLSVGVLPVFLVGALSTRMGDDLGFGAGGTGLVVAVFFSAGGLAAIPFGMVSDRIGARRGIRIGVAVSAAATTTVALGVGSYWQLLLLMAVAGSVVGFIDTGGARLITGSVHHRRHGLAFGIKEASVPGASMLAGASIPLVAERFGWRPMFVAGALALPFLWVLLPRGDGPGDLSADAGAGDGSARDSTSMVVFATAVALSVGAATAAATFLVPATVATGITEGEAGVVLAVASVVSMTVRVVSGIVGDRRPDRTPVLVLSLMVAGAIGAGALSVEGGAGLTVVGSILVLGAGWGWTGLAFLLAVRATPTAPSTAAGVVLTGLAAGGVAGPAAFGLLASWASYRAAWVAVASAMLVGAALSRRATDR